MITDTTDPSANALQTPPALPNDAGDSTPVAGAQDRAAAEAAIDDAAMKELLLMKSDLPDLGLFPITLCTTALLREVKSPFINGVDLEHIGNIELQVAIFLYFHSFDLMDDETLREVSSTARDPERLLVEAMKIARLIQGRTVTLVRHVYAKIREGNEMAVRVIPRAEKKGNNLSAVHRMLAGKDAKGPKA